MSIRLVAVDVNPKKGVMLHLDWTSLNMQLCRTASFTFFSLPYTKAHVQYNLASFSCTIRTGSSLLYDINLGATHTTILSIRGVMIPIYLVSSTTDSIRQCVVLFKAVPIPTSDCSRWLRLRMPGQRQKKVSERRWWVPSTMRRQVTRNTSNNDGDSTLTIVPLCRELSGTKITPGKWWKSRGQVGKLWTLQEILYTACIYFMTHPWVIWYDSEGDAACAIISTLIVMSHKDSSQMTKWWRVMTHS